MIDSINQKPISATGLLTSAGTAGIAGGAIARFTPNKKYKHAKQVVNNIALDYFNKDGKLLIREIERFSGLNAEIINHLKGKKDIIKTPIQFLKESAKKGDISSKTILRQLTKGRNRLFIWTASAAAVGAGLYLSAKTLFKEKEAK